MPAQQSTQPVSSYLLLLILGFLPVILVALFWDDLPHRFVVQWNLGGLTISGTRSRSAMTLAVACAGIALLAVMIAAIQNESFKASGIRRLFLALNYMQVITIGLTCAMIVTEAIGFPFRVRHVIPASAALMLAVAALLCLRIAGGAATSVRRFIFGAFGWLFILASNRDRRRDNPLHRHAPQPRRPRRRVAACTPAGNPGTSHLGLERNSTPSRGDAKATPDISFAPKAQQDRTALRAERSPWRLRGLAWNFLFCPPLKRPPGALSLPRRRLVSILSSPPNW